MAKRSTITALSYIGLYVAQVSRVEHRDRSEFRDGRYPCSSHSLGIRGGASMERTVILAGTLIVVGIVLTGLSAVQLGIARAAAKWPSARAPRLGRGPALVGIIAGALFAGAAGALVATPPPAAGH